jgi:molecular chaperone HtpG
MVKYLEIQDRPDLLGRATELPVKVGRWLGYIPAMFSHYTSHMIDHSDEIIDQLGKLIFEDDDFSKPTISLSAVEAYILIVCAYLHDAGMVCSETERLSILRSREWQQFTGPNGPGHEQNQVLSDLDELTFASHEEYIVVASVRLRYLVAEFVRREHHVRSGNLFDLHPELVVNFTLGDPILSRALQSVCEAHGLASASLDDARYPLETDIASQKVNLRLMAILLRLADLLDMRHDRACSLLAPAVGKLPPESEVHWSRNQRLTSHLTSPSEIRLKAECVTQEEHRSLLDWCTWLVDEARDSSQLLRQSLRHKEWRSPRVTLSGDDPTIIIQPKDGATYQVRDWNFRLDVSSVLELLTDHVHSEPLGFLRELIQNSLDATRCSVIETHFAGNGNWLEALRGSELEIANRYSLSIEVAEPSSLTGPPLEAEAVQSIVVSDHGIGMDIERIEKYFLQIGHSYYRSSEFRERFGFQPIARFGVGFLSVFQYSDHIVVETLAKEPGSKPIQLTLTGPRNYFLVEEGNRTEPGTTVIVRLRNRIDPSLVVEAVKGWCKMVEFPINLRTVESTDFITGEDPESFVQGPIPVVTRTDTDFYIRRRHLNRDGVIGSLYLLEVLDSRGPKWNLSGWARYRYPSEHPSAVVPPLPDSLRCLHGLAIGGHPSFSSGPSSRIDVRKDIKVSLSRVGPSDSREDNIRKILDEEWNLWIRAHLEDLKAGMDDEQYWRYATSLCEEFQPIWKDWETIHGLIPGFLGGSRRFATLTEMAAPNVIHLVAAKRPRFSFQEGSKGVEDAREPRNLEIAKEFSESVTEPVLCDTDLQMMSNEVCKRLFDRLRPLSVRDSSEATFISFEQVPHGSEFTFGKSSMEGVFLCAFESFSDSQICLNVPPLHQGILSDVLMNANHPITVWWLDLVAACSVSDDPELLRRYAELRSHIARDMTDMLRYGNALRRDRFLEYVTNWNSSDPFPTLPSPPSITVCKGLTRFSENTLIE